MECFNLHTSISKEISYEKVILSIDHHDGALGMEL